MINEGCYHEFIFHVTDLRYTYPHHGHAENKRGDKVNRGLAVTLAQLVERVEEISPTHNP